MNLCDRWPALDPLRIRATRSGEVFLLVRRVIEYNDTHHGETNETTPSETKSLNQKGGNTELLPRNGKVYVPAGDDWF